MSHRLLVPLVHPLDPERHGSKAARLARLADLGGPVPPGLVIPAPVHAAALREAAVGETPRVPRDLAKALTGALAELGPPPWVVRTSASTEDLPGASAAGLFRSELGLEDAAGVVAAVERCWQAAHAERVGVYLGAIGRGGPPLPTVAILIQRQVRAPWAGVLFTRDPRQGPSSEHLRCELARGSTTAVTAGLADPVAYTLDRSGSSSPPLPPDTGATALDLVELAGLAEQVAAGPADVELALTDAGVVVLQVRPITAFRSAALRPDELGDDGLPWRWDAEHNPAPLSPLHGSLVARLDRIPSLPFRMRCVGGYLYSAPRPGAPAAPEESPEQVRQAWPQRRRQIEEHLEGLEELDAGETPLTALLPAFDAFYERYAALAGATLAGSHRRLAARIDDRLSGGTLAPEQIPEALGGVATPLTTALSELARQAAAHGLVDGLAEGREVSAEPGGAAFESGLAGVIRRLGALPPVWDVAVPTLAESPAALRRTVAALARAGTPPGARPGPRLDAARSEPVDPHLHNLAADEEDDLLFARGLAVLRRAFLRAGAHLGQAQRLDRPEDVFRLTLAPLLKALGSGPDSGADLRALLTPEPVEAPEGPMADGPWAHGPLRGFGSGAGTVTARALVVRRLAGRLEDLAGAARGRIVVCPSLLPSAVVLLAGASGIVTDHGGLLSHGAILARELGLPAVLATHSATAQIATDDLLWLDAAQGLVIRL